MYSKSNSFTPAKDLSLTPSFAFYIASTILIYSSLNPDTLQYNLHYIYALLCTHAYAEEYIHIKYFKSSYKQINIKQFIAMKNRIGKVLQDLVGKSTGNPNISRVKQCEFMSRKSCSNNLLEFFRYPRQGK